MQNYDSENFNQETHRFENTENRNQAKNTKGRFRLFGLFSSFINRPYDKYEEIGFPFIERSADELNGLHDEIIWVGQSTLILNHKGITLMTDPIFSGRASPFRSFGPKRVTPLPFSIEELPRIDIVLISHSHYDHLDKDSIKRLSRMQPDIQYYVPLGLKKLLQGWGAKNVVEMDWWQSADLEGIEITATPVRHWSSRRPFNRNKTLWAGWMVGWPDFRFYFAGDTGYSQDFVATRQRLGVPDLAAIPIGAYEPRDFMKASHVNPKEAVQILADLGAPKAVAIHWGTFKLTLEPMNEPPIKLQEALDAATLKGQDFLVLKHGESVSIK